MSLIPYLTSSRTRFQKYVTDLRQRLLQKQTAPDPAVAAADTPQPEAGLKPTGRRFVSLALELFALVKTNQITIVVSLCILTLSTLLGLIPVYGTKVIIDSILGVQPLRLPVWGPVDVQAISKEKLLSIVVLTMAGVSVIAIAIGIWSRWQCNKLAHLVTVRLQKRVFEHIMRLPFHRVSELKTGGAVSMLREDAGGVGMLVFGMIYNPWQAVVQLAGILGILLWTDPRMFLASIAVIPAVYFTHKTWIARIRPLFSDIRSTRQGIDAHTTEAIGGFRVVRSFSRQNHEVARYAVRNHFMIRQEALSWWWARVIDIGWLLFMPLATAGIFWFGGLRVLQDTHAVATGTLAADRALTVGDLVMFLTYLAWLLGPLNTLVSAATELQNSLAGLDRILNLLGERTETQPRPDAVRIDVSKPTGEFNLVDLCYAYPAPRPAKDAPAPNPPTQGKSVLSNVTLRVLPGELVALVGKSGSGKTTLCNLLARFYDPTHGAIHYDGIDIRKIDITSYRSLFGIVEQETFLFDGTIADNIAYGRPTASHDEISHAAAQANAHDFINQLPQRYQTRVGERGLKLSGGQRQRISIARAILTDPRVLILDEATSALDSHTERQIQDSLKRLMQGRTSFVIAHRLSTIVHADKIVMLDQGRIIGFSNHDDLLSNCQPYREMYELQTRAGRERLD